MSQTKPSLLTRDSSPASCRTEAHGVHEDGPDDRDIPKGTAGQKARASVKMRVWCMDMRKRKTDMIPRSSAAEYLTFIASAGDSAQSFEVRYEDENIWLTQRMMAELYDVSAAAISQHIKRIYEDGELTPGQLLRNT